MMIENEQQNDLPILYSLIEKTFGKEISENEDYIKLSDCIFAQTHERISESTLKRMFGYVSSDHQPRRSTLDVLSRYVGYKDWHTFLQANDKANGLVESNLMFAKSLLAKDLIRGERVVVRWQPDRICILRYVGQERFVVEEVRGSKLSVGDTFRCDLFIQGEPLFLSDATIGGVPHQRYVCGKVHGIQFNVKSD